MYTTGTFINHLTIKAINPTTYPPLSLKTLYSPNPPQTSVLPQILSRFLNLNNPPILHHNHAIKPLNRFQPMRDRYQSMISELFTNELLNLGIRLAVDTMTVTH
jgi:hypothetical protein